MFIKQSKNINDISVIILLASNLIPLFGVFFFNWDIFTVILLFWLESAIIGIFNVLKMIIRANYSIKIDKKVLGYSVFLRIPFFIFHYGMFMLVHLLFIVVIFGSQGSLPKVFGSPIHLFVGELLSTQFVIIKWAFISLVISHGLSFVVNFLKKKEYHKITLEKLMSAPYGRIMIMHLTILLGGFLSLALGVPPIALALMILLKVIVDYLAHNKEHQKII